MEDRKVYHLINGEFVHDGMPSMRIPTYEELSAHIAILNNVGFFDDPIAESVTFDGISNGKRSDAVQASLYDAMMAELSAEKQNRRDKFMRKNKSRTKEKMQSLRYRNRSGIAEEKIPDNCHSRGHDADKGYWRNWRAYCEMKSIPEWKAEDRERSLRKDWIGEQKDIDAEIYEAECLKEQIEQAKQDMNRIVQRIDHRVNQYAEIVNKLMKLEDPTDWESLDAYLNAIDTAEWYVFD